MEALVGLRDRKKAGVRAALVEAAMRLFGERGFDGVTVDEITAAADVSRRTFFRYFTTKEAVVFARREEQHAVFRDMLAASEEEDAFQAIRAALLVLAEDYQKQRRRILAEQALLRATPSLATHDLEVDRAFEAAIVDYLLAKSRRTVHDRRRARIVAAAIVGAVRVTIEEWAERHGDLDLAKVGNDALDLLAPLAPTPR